MSPRFFQLSATALCLTLGQISYGLTEETEIDLCVYGGTSGGVIAAVQGARMGKRVILVEPGRHLGGMTSGGLSAVDIGEPRSVGGLTREYFTRLVARYGKQLNWGEGFDTAGKGGPATGGAYSIEPHVAEEVFDEMVREAGVVIWREGRLASVKKSGSRILSLRCEDGRIVKAKQFIDATYEGDLMAAAGVEFTVTREGNLKYGETYNGIHYNEKFLPRENFPQPNESGRLPSGYGVWDRDFPLDPYRIKGNPSSGLLPLINEGGEGNSGDPAPGVQAYCYRLCLTTDQSNMIPIDPPQNYDPARFELVARFIEACLENGDEMDLRWFSKHDPLPNEKWDFNTATFGGNLPGLSWKWPEASYAEREVLAQELEDYHRGLFHFLRTDPRIPDQVKKDLARFGLPKDEFRDTGGWPHQVYIREGRRMVSDLVMTEHHTFGRERVSHPVSLGSYGTDAHEIRRIVRNGVVTREGKIATGRGGFGPYQIGYGAIVPKASQCSNLLVTFALSASHSAFASIRMEPPFMISSQSAATAACLAIDAEVDIQEVDQSALKSLLLRDGQILEWRGKSSRPILQGIVLDDPAASYTGEWGTSNATGSLAGNGYRHDSNRRDPVKTATFEHTVSEAGLYGISLLYSAHENRSTRTKVVLSSAGDETTCQVNQRLPILLDGTTRRITQVPLSPASPLSVTISNEGSDGVVSIDGLQLVRVPEN